MITARTLPYLWRMARPSQLLAVVLVALWGGLLALDGFELESFLTGLLPLLFVSASVHYANEYADYETDALTVRTPFSGGSGGLVDSGLPRSSSLWAAWVSLLLGLSAAGTLIFLGRLEPVTLPVLALGALGGWMYSLRPLSLAWRGWGEVDNAFLGGMLLPAYGFAVQSGRLDGRVFLIALPFGLLVFNNLLATTWADRRADGLVGKYTLATRWPTGRLGSLYFLVVLLAFTAMFALHGRLLPTIICWLSLLILPAAIWAGWAYTRQHSPFPSVLVMVLYLVVQLAGWSLISLA